MPIPPERPIEKPVYTLPKEKPPSMWFLDDKEFFFLCEHRPGDIAGFLNGRVSMEIIKASLDQDYCWRYPYKNWSGLYPEE